MAGKDKNDEQEQVEAKASGPSFWAAKKKLILLSTLGLLLVVATVAGTLVMLGFFDSGEVEVETETATETAEPLVSKPPAAMYFPIKPPFVVNFQARGKQRYLEAELSIMTRDMDVFNAMQAHAPLIKNRVIMLLSGEVYEDLQSAEGKELLRQKILQTLEETMQQEIGKTGIEQVLFTNFVMQ
jgi:flagellar FliL protein